MFSAMFFEFGDWVNDELWLLIGSWGFLGGVGMFGFLEFQGGLIGICRLLLGELTVGSWA